MALLLRLNKAAPLTNTEMDNNLKYLDDRCTSLENTKLSSADLLAHIKFIDGVDSGVDADKLQGMSPSSVNLFSSLVARDATGSFAATSITATNFIGTASIANVAHTLDGIVAIANGGTGSSSLTPGYVTSSGANLTTLTKIPGVDINGDILGRASNVTGVVNIANGGTGGTSATEARAALGLVIGQTVQAYSPALQMMSNISVSGLLMYGNGIVTARQLVAGTGLIVSNGNGIYGDPTISISTVAITNGGTGAIDAAGARASLGVPAADNAVLTGVPLAPTAAVGTNSSQIATTSFVINNSVPTGTILTLATPAVPPGYLQANGSQVLRASYPNLFNAIGVLFGNGNGSTTFTLPNWGTPVGFIAVIKT